MSWLLLLWLLGPKLPVAHGNVLRRIVVGAVRVRRNFLGGLRLRGQSGFAFLKREGKKSSLAHTRFKVGFYPGGIQRYVCQPPFPMLSRGIDIPIHHHNGAAALWPAFCRCYPVSRRCPLQNGTCSSVRPRRPRCTGGVATSPMLRAYSCTSTVPSRAHGTAQASFAAITESDEQSPCTQRALEGVRGSVLWARSAPLTGTRRPAR
jgi:hypothetical protein